MLALRPDATSPTPLPAKPRGPTRASRLRNPLRQSRHDLDVVLRHRLPPPPGTVFGGSMALVDVDAGRAADELAIHAVTIWVARNAHVSGSVCGARTSRRAEV